MVIIVLSPRWLVNLTSPNTIMFGKDLAQFTIVTIAMCCSLFGCIEMSTKLIFIINQYLIDCSSNTYEINFLFM